MPVRLSYINARGDEAILDDDEGSFAHELIGREGMEFPELKLNEHEYGNGFTDIVAITVKNRKVTCYFWADPPDIPHWEEKFNEVKSILLQTGQKENEWGKLKIRMEDGHYVYLNCVYEKGLDSVIRDNLSRVKFSLTFKATDPYFYNGFEYSYTIGQSDEHGYLFMKDCLIVDSKKEAVNITNESTAGNSWFEVKTPNKGTKYYCILKNSTVYMKDSVKSNTLSAAKAIAEPDGGASMLNLLYWGVPSNSNAQYYYTIKPETTLYMRSAEGNIQEDYYVQAERVYPKIVINGPAENVCLINETTGRKIELSSAVKLATNKKITIITTPMKRSIKRSSTNLIPYLSDDSTLDWYLDHGINSIVFNNSSTTPETYLRFYYTERRLSVQ